jgi:hypothetical protein
MAFEQDDITATKRFYNSRFCLARCGDDLLVGTAGSSRVSVWSAGAAEEAYAMGLSLDTPFEPTPPLYTIDLEEIFQCGDVQLMGGSECV